MQFARIFPAILIVGIAALLHVHTSSAVDAAQQTPKSTKTAATDLRTLVAADLQQAAKRVGLKVDESHVMVATRDDASVSIAPAEGQKDTFLFMHASFALAGCNQLFPEGYYSVRVVPGAQGTNPTKAQFVNSEGKVVATGRLTSETRKAQPEEKDKTQVGIQLRHTGGPTAMTTVGVCKCQWIPWFRWRRLHVVVT